MRVRGGIPVCFRADAARARNVHAPRVQAAALGGIATSRRRHRAGTRTFPFKQISSAGPIDEIWLGDRAELPDEAHADAAFSFYPSSRRAAGLGTMLEVGGTVYGPDFANTTAASDLRHALHAADPDRRLRRRLARDPVRGHDARGRRATGIRARAHAVRHRRELDSRLTIATPPQRRCR